MKKIAVITVIYKYPKDLLNKFVASVLQNGIDRKDLFIRDNTHDDVGYGVGINKVLEKILNEYDYFFIVNPDTILQKNTVKILLDTLLKDKSTGIVGPLILDKDGRIWSAGGVLDKKRYSAGLLDNGKKVSKQKNIYEVNFVPGTAMLIRREVFEKIGLFSKDLFLYYDEVDFCFRAKKAGFNLSINPKAVITHYASSTVGEDSPAMSYFMARNHLYFLEKFAPLSIKIREFIRFPKTIYEARYNKAELIGILDYFLRKKGNNVSMLSQIDV